MSPIGKSGGIGGDSWRSNGGGGNLPNSNQNNSNNNNSNNSSLSNVGGNINDGGVGGPLAVMSAEQYRTLNRKTPFSSSWGDLFR